MPLEAWIKCTEEGEFKYVLKNPKETDEEELHDAWCVVYDDYIKRFGLGKLYIRLLEIMREKAIIELDYVITRDKFKLTELSIAEAKLKGMLANGGSGIDIATTLVYLSKWLGYRLNPKEITVNEFFKIREQYGKENNKSGHK